MPNCRNTINADLIAQGMAPFSPETAAFRAGRFMLIEIDLWHGAEPISVLKRRY
jgi:predicted ABC-type ATPase